jgi:hypothetical protein
MSQGVYETVSRIKLTIAPDSSFTLEDAGVPKTGTVEPLDGKFVLRLKTSLGRNVEKEPGYELSRSKPAELTRKSATKLEYFDPAGFDAKPITLERQTG